MFALGLAPSLLLTVFPVGRDVVDSCRSIRDNYWLSVPRPLTSSGAQHQRCSCLHSPCGRLRLPTGSAGHAGATVNLKLI
jgi:hypothetical protein